jgi:hypothetical protein
LYCVGFLGNLKDLWGVLAWIFSLGLNREFRDMQKNRVWKGFYVKIMMENRIVEIKGDRR